MSVSLPLTTSSDGMVEVKLLQVVAGAVGNDVAAGVDVDGHGISRVLESDRPGDVVEFDGLQRFVQMGAANIDGGLFLALGAGRVGGVQPAPAQRAGFAVVIPMGGGLGWGQRQLPKQRTKKGRRFASTIPHKLIRLLPVHSRRSGRSGGGLSGPIRLER